MRDEDTVRQAFEAQASSADESRELCDIFGLDSGGRHKQPHLYGKVYSVD